MIVYIKEKCYTEHNKTDKMIEELYENIRKSKTFTIIIEYFSAAWMWMCLSIQKLGYFIILNPCLSVAENITLQ